MKLSIIVAFDENRLIGRDNGLPWHLPADLKHFKELTMGHCMIMGRKTYESIGKPLPGRTSVIITRSSDFSAGGCVIVNSISQALDYCRNQDQAFVIGGAEIFKSAMPLVTTLLVTQIHHQFEGDIFFPEINPEEWKLTSSEKQYADEKNKWDYTFIKYERIAK